MTEKKMDVTRYQKYVDFVNADLIPEAASEFYAENLVTTENGTTYTGKQATLDLIDFTHSRMRQTIELIAFFSSTEGKFAVEAYLIYEALQDLDEEEFKKAGYPEVFMPLKKGETYRMHCFFNYQADNDLKFKRIQVFSTVD